MFIIICIILDGLFLEMNPDGSVRGSPEKNQNCKQPLQTWGKKAQFTVREPL